jgi:DNA-binding transcriptional LysR family regulator
MKLTVPPDLSSRQLRAVLAVAEYRSFIAAAAFLKVSQPALTRTIKLIENALGVELFTRTTRQVAATLAGKEFIALAERLLSDLVLGIDNLQRHATHQRGRLAISSVLSFADESFASLLTAYRREYPSVEVILREGMQDHVVDDLRSGAADIGIGYTNNLPDIFVADARGVETLHVVFRTSNPLATRKKVAMSELKDLDLVSYPMDSRTRRLLDSAAAAAKFLPRHTVTVNRLPTLLRLVREGIGIAVVPSSERPLPTDRRLTSRPLARAPISRLGVLRLRERELSPTARHFAELAKDWLRRTAPSGLKLAKRSAARK